MGWRPWIVPLAIVLMIVVGMRLSRYISLPTLAFTYAKHHGETRTIEFVVEGVHCYGTANALRQHIAREPGLVSLVAYGSRNRVVIEYDASLTDVARLQHVIEAPLITRRGPMSVFKVVSVRER